MVNAIASLRGLSPNAFGPGSSARNRAQKVIEDLGLADTVGITESDNSTEAYDKVVEAISLLKVSLGLERMRAATYGEFRDRYMKNGWAPSEYNVFKTRYNQQLDQRAFVFQMLSREEASKLLKSMTPAERRRFEQSLEVSDRQIVQTPEGGW